MTACYVAACGSYAAAGILYHRTCHEIGSVGAGLVLLHKLAVAVIDHYDYILTDRTNSFCYSFYILNEEGRTQAVAARTLDIYHFYIFGQSGAGKSHICTAICGALIERSKDVYYMPWRDESTALKSLVTDAAAYTGRMRVLKKTEVLYIDDFLKGGDTDADIRLAYEILNSRYNDRGLRTILSSEMTPEKLLRRTKSPYPKTCSPEFSRIIRGMALRLASDADAPLFSLIDRNRVIDLAQSDLNPVDTPWFGQLMAGPQLLGYLWQVDRWMRERNIRIAL